jgi:hypothetical protein
MEGLPDLGMLWKGLLIADPYRPNPAMPAGLGWGLHGELIGWEVKKDHSFSLGQWSAIKGGEDQGVPKAGKPWGLLVSMAT